MKNTNGRAFVLLAGGGMGAWIWTRLVPLLAYPSVAVDRRVGDIKGRATIGDCAEHVAHVIREASVREAILVAHSGAGILAPFAGEARSSPRRR
jgi:pimeloyl-ACP methyl ester carboxylesterase